VNNELLPALKLRWTFFPSTVQTM